MRFHIFWRRINEPEDAFRDFFETDDILQAKDFAMRLAFDETSVVFVEDSKNGGVVRDFDDPAYLN